MTKEKFCNFVGFFVFFLGSILFIAFIIMGIVNLVEASKVADELVKETLLNAAYMKFIYALISPVGALILSALMFALEKIIITLSDIQKKLPKAD